MLFRSLPRDLAGRVFAYLPRDHQEGLLRSLTNEQARAVLKGMTPDDQAVLLVANLRVVETDLAEGRRRLCSLEAESGYARFRSGRRSEPAGCYRLVPSDDGEVRFVIYSEERDDGTTKTKDQAVMTFTNIGGAWKLRDPNYAATDISPPDAAQ